MSNEGYDPEKDKILYKEGINIKKEKNERYINVKAYQYDGGEKKIRLEVKNRNTNPDAPDEKKWIGQKGISAITKSEAQALVKALEKAITQI